MTKIRGRARALRKAVTAESFRRRYANVGHLLSGNAATLVIGLFAVALTARALGPHEYGILALVISGAQAIDSFVNFQTWQPLIRYGADLDDEAHRDELMALFKYGLLLDMAAAFTGWMIALGVTAIAGFLLGWETAVYATVLTYSLVLLFRVNGTPVAILRLAGKFRATAYLQVLGVGARLIGCAIAFAMGGGVFAFAVIWMTTQILSQLLLAFAAWRELRSRGLHRLDKASLKGIRARFPGIWGFTWSANFSLTLWSSAQQLDVLLVGALTDPASAGLYHIAKRIGRAVQQAGAQVQAVAYPEIARLWQAGAIRAFRNVVLQTEMLLASAGLALFCATLLVAKPVILLVAGKAFAGAAPLLVVQMVAVTLVLSGSIARVALLSMGRERQIFGLVVLSIALFFATAALLIPRIGPMGANIAHIVLGSVWLLGLSILLKSELAQARRDDERAASSCEQSPAADRCADTLRHDAA